MRKNIYWSQLRGKQKVDYYFQYYFGWTLLTIVIMLFVVFYAWQVLSKETPDIFVISVGNYIPSDETTTALTDYLKDNVPDANGDKKICIDFNKIVDNIDEFGSEINYMNQQKYLTLLGEGHSRILLMDEDHYEATLADEQFDGFLSDLTDISSASVYKSYAVPVKNTEMYDIPELEFYRDYYIVLTEISDNKKTGGINLERFNAGREFISNIVK